MDLPSAFWDLREKLGSMHAAVNSGLNPRGMAQVIGRSYLGPPSCTAPSLLQTGSFPSCGTLTL